MVKNTVFVNLKVSRLAVRILHDRVNSITHPVPVNLAVLSLFVSETYTHIWVKKLQTLKGMLIVGFTSIQVYISNTICIFLNASEEKNINRFP